MILSIVTVSDGNVLEFGKTRGCVEEFLRITESRKVQAEWIVISKEKLEIPTENTRIIIGKDHGIFDAMNMGLCLSQGEFILFLNAGDAIAIDSIPATIDALSCSSRNSIRYCNRIDLYESSKRKRVVDGARVWRGMEICHNGIFFPKSTTLGVLYSTNLFAADYKFFLDCASNPKCEGIEPIENAFVFFDKTGISYEFFWKSWRSEVFVGLKSLPVSRKICFLFFQIAKGVRYIGKKYLSFFRVRTH